MDSYKTKKFSQFGQDGVIERVFELIGPTDKYFVEFGSSGNDAGCGNTPNLRRKGFDGLLIDANKNPYGRDNIPIYDIKYHRITKENVIDIFKMYNVPETFDFLSIDIDGNDYYIWECILTQYKPRVVCIESNYSIPITMSVVQPYKPEHTWVGGSRYGASALALKKLGNLYGYHVVAVCGCDLIFVSDADIHNIKARDINNLEKLCYLEDHRIADPNYLKELTQSALNWDEWVTV